MYLYNITFIADDAVAAEWVSWLEKTYIPKIMATGKFTSHKVWRIIDSPNEGVTYSSQYFFENLEDYVDYLTEYAPQLEAELYEKYGEKVVSFASTMQDEL
ncbi:DUF4286 family protein [Pedobacter sp.]|uniref:DUF4286 family protein n=1 Tax=Pedobacter sp. TaxID=1411316 RepID=UPI003D7FC3BB